MGETRPPASGFFSFLCVYSLGLLIILPCGAEDSWGGHQGRVFPQGVWSLGRASREAGGLVPSSQPELPFTGGLHSRFSLMK